MMGAGVMLGYARSGLAAVEFLASGTQEFWSGSSAGELFEPTIWYGIDRSGAVTVNVIRAEMGQHVGTALARIVADELEADWDKVSDRRTSTPIRNGAKCLPAAAGRCGRVFPVLSRAGAAGRIALVEEGAKLLGVSPTKLHGAQRRGRGRRKIDSLWRYRGAWRPAADLHARAAGRNSDQSRRQNAA